MGETRVTKDELPLVVENALDALESLFDQSAESGREASERRADARRRALELSAAYAPGRSSVEVAALSFAADSFCATAVDLAGHPREAERLIKQIEATAQIRRAVLGREVLRSPQLLLLPTAVAVEAQLDLLLAFAEVDAVSLWMLEAGGGLKHIRHAGDFKLASKETRRLARRMLTSAGPSIDTSDDGILGVTIERWGQSAAALIIRGKPPGEDHRMALIEAVVPILGEILAREEMLARLNASEQDLVASVERKLARLRFDIHDGPQQDVALMAEDLRLFRAQLSSILDGIVAERLLGRLDDLKGMLAAVEADLRRISASGQSPFLGLDSFPDALAEVVDAFAARAGIDPQMSLIGDFSNLTDSQQIGLLALIREALSNIRAHSDAREVTVAIAAHPDGVRAEVTDDGKGFDPEAVLVAAARAGRLGLVGMQERIRLLGGRARIDSQPGGPTIISVELPPGPFAAIARPPATAL